MRSNETTSPPGLGMQAPDSPVPAPRAVTGTRCSRAIFNAAATAAVSSGKTTTSGLTARGFKDSSNPYAASILSPARTASRPSAPTRSATNPVVTNVSSGG